MFPYESYLYPSVIPMPNTSLDLNVLSLWSWWWYESHRIRLIFHSSIPSHNTSLLSLDMPIPHITYRFLFLSSYPTGHLHSPSDRRNEVTSEPLKEPNNPSSYHRVECCQSFTYRSLNQHTNEGKNRDYERARRQTRHRILLVLSSPCSLSYVDTACKGWSKKGRTNMRDRFLVPWLRWWGWN